MKRLKLLIWVVPLFLLLWAAPISASAAGRQTIYNSPYVSFSPDGQAWTTNAGERNYIQYPMGTTVTTGIDSSLRSPEKGEHTYGYAREGTIPVGSWSVTFPYGHCIHDDHEQTGNFHGVSYNLFSCKQMYFSGWMATCADCGERLNNMYIYMSREAAASIDYLEMYRDIYYYYLCPHCNNLEQGHPMGLHTCQAISWNQYKVVYNPNAGGEHGGIMADSTHMYNNATEYEGRTVTPATHLSRNTFTRVGYEFAGWNTKPDGTGDSYEDGAEIWNLTAEEKGTVTLYAQWRLSRSTLHIDPNGGSYQGSTEVISVQGDYGSTYTAGAEDVTAPAGYTVSFETNGGGAVPSVTGTTHFAEWSMQQPFMGRMTGNTYLFTAPDGNVDTIKARYEADPVILPDAERGGYSFGGWYYDSGFVRAAGGAGDVITPDDDMTLYAQWVELVLISQDNYADNDGRGAVDLSWSQPDGRDKNYLTYQSTDGENWVRINAADNIGNERCVDVFLDYTGGSRGFTVPYTGLYTLTARGAQGGSYGGFQGGAGGSISAVFWLEAGELLTCTVGGQDGFNGGGLATDYGNGGGYTSISSNRKGVLLIAGGGGGASVSGEGGAGGSEAKVIDTDAGASGMAGGGGGYQGGASGEYQVHYHDQSSDCYHQHTGSSETGGGCYGIAVQHTEQRTCNPAGAWTDVATWAHNIGCGGTVTMNRYDWYGTNGCHILHSTVKTVVCSVCGDLGDEGTPAGSHTFPYTTTTYELSCGYPAGYFCGYQNGQVISSQPAYGGSSYVNTDYARSYVRQAGVNAGSGEAIIQSHTVGFVEDMELKGVQAPDLAAPEKVSEHVKLEPVGESRVRVIWEEPKDRGTEYYHVVESFAAQTDKPLCRSNVTRNVLVSGMAGYYFLVNQAPYTEVSASNGQFTVEREGMIEFDEDIPDQRKYLHIAPVDVAGNVGETVHICVENTDGGVAWNLYTEQMDLESGDNVYSAGDNVWYVKSDGRTPFALLYRSRMEGPASEAYQQNYVIFETCVEETARNILFVPSREIRDGEIRMEAADMLYSQQGNPPLVTYPYSVVSRSDRSRVVSAVQKFVLPTALSGTEIDIWPVAGADYEDTVVYSKHDLDRQNGITVIADGEAPVISGLELLDYRELIDRRDGTLILNVTAEDELSGVRDVYISIVNTDNATEKLYRPGEDGIIRIEITADEPIFSGDFAVTAIAVDNVGNVAEISYGTTEFALEADVERILEPHDPVFKSGESGILMISVWGYAERVEVEFPEAMTALDPGLNQTFDYTGQPAYVHEERLQFMIPLGIAENGSYTITVRAYKGDKQLEKHPAVGVVQIDGTVLDEFRTRLR